MKETWLAFGLQAPEHWPENVSSPPKWNDHCDPRTPFETQGGEMVVHKRKAWRGLALSLAVTVNHLYAYHNLLWGDKMVNQVGFKGVSYSRI